MKETLAPLSETLLTLERQIPLGDIAWPDECVAFLQEEGCFRAAIEAAYGGRELSAVDQLDVYRRVAAGSLSLALILTQHDGACQFLQSSDNKAYCAPILRDLAAGKGIATIGISQLTTSHQQGPPALKATPAPEGFVLNGMIPWMTSAAHAAWLVIGATCEDGDQLLTCLPGKSKGLEIKSPGQLMALNTSWTSRAMCRDLHVQSHAILRGPAPAVLARRSPVKALTVSAVGMGLAERLLVHCRQTIKDDAFDDILRFAHDAYEALDGQLLEAAQGEPRDKAETTTLRASINGLLTKLAATALTLAKGSGYAEDHPIQRDIREAMFFLVWSAPTTLRQETLKQLWGMD